MRIRQQSNHGNVRWVVDYRDGRGKRRQRFFKSGPEAQAFAMTVSYGKPSRDKGPSYTMENLFDAYINATRHRRGPAASRSVLYRARQVLRALDILGVAFSHDLDKNTFGQLYEFFTNRELAEATIHSYMTLFRSAAGHAIFHGILSARDLGRMTLPELRKRKERFLSKTEIETLLSHLTDHVLQLPVALGIYAGLRRSEVCNLVEADVDLTRVELTVTRSKNKRWRTLRLHPRLQGYLPQTLGQNSDPLCLNTRSQRWLADAITHSFQRRATELGTAWGDVSFHTLRHTCASQMAQSGKYTLYQIAAFLGHRTVSTTQKYAHLLPNQVVPDW